MSVAPKSLDKLVTYIEEVKLISGSADGVGEKQDIALQPFDLDRWVLETDAGA